MFTVSLGVKSRLIREKIPKRSARSRTTRVYASRMPFEGIQGLQKSEMPRSNAGPVSGPPVLCTAFACCTCFQSRATVMGPAAESNERACKRRENGVRVSNMRVVTRGPRNRLYGTLTFNGVHVRQSFVSSFCSRVERYRLFRW